MHLSSLERKILNCLQKDIPLSCRPFGILSKSLGIKEEDFLRKIKEFKEKGIIHRFSPILNHRKLGFKGSLLAFRVSEDRVGALAKKICQYPEVTHCFLREGDYNLWIAFIYKNKKLETFLNKIAREIGRENILNLNTLRQFKLDTRLKI